VELKYYVLGATKVVTNVIVWGRRMNVGAERAAEEETLRDCMRTARLTEKEKWL
jgi:hypothetical protein